MPRRLPTILALDEGNKLILRPDWRTEHEKRARGRPKRPFTRAVANSWRVEQLRAKGMTVREACTEVAAQDCGTANDIETIRNDWYHVYKAK